MRRFIQPAATLVRSASPHLRNGAWLTVKNVTVAFSSLLVTYAGANFLTPDTFGSYKYIISIIAVASLFALTGTNSALVRTIAKHRENPIRFLIAKNFSFSLIVSTGLAAVALYYFAHQNYLFGTSFLAVALLHPFRTASSLYSGYLNATQRYRAFALTNIANNVISSCAVALVMFLTKNVFLMILAYFGTKTVVNIVIYLYLRHKHRFPKTSPVDLVAFRFAKKLSALNLLQKAVDQMDILLAFQLVNPAAAAAFAIAKTPVQLLTSQGSMIRTLALPRFSRHAPATIRTTIHQKVLLFSALMALIAVVYIAVAPILYQLLFPQYLDSVHLSQILALILPALPYLLYLEALTAAENVRILFILETITPLVRFATITALALGFGLIGLVLGFVIGYWLRALVVIFMYYHVL